MWLKKKDKIIFETKSMGMQIQVIDRMERRELKFGNHVVQSAFSKTNPDFLLLSYTQYMTIGLVLCASSEMFLHIGLGAGNIPRFIHKHYPWVYQEVIELNPEVISVAYRYFNLPRNERIRVLVGDGFSIMASCKKKYDLIFLDAFQADGTPSHLNTIEFFRRLSRNLKPGGWVVGNLWTSQEEFSDKIKKWQEVFEVVWEAPVPIMGNVILFGANQKHPFDQAMLQKKAQVIQQQIPLKFFDFLKNLVPVQPSEA